ncbi:MAG: TonB-dependent receptor [Bacteroidia bacterium]|jgi:Carboxypeptidase regulatory-like domain
MIRLKRGMLLIMVILLSFLAKAQETTAEIQGLISSSEGALPFVTVIATHVPTGTKYGTTTREDGRFNLPNLKIGGPYTIDVSFVGLKPGHQEGITLFLGQTYKQNFLLTADVTQVGEVVVTAFNDKAFSSSRTGSQELITRTQVDRLPTINRSIQDFVKLEPTSNGLNIGGRSNQYNNMTVDGANFNNSFGLSSILGGQTSAQPISLEAIEQIQVNVSPYDVKQGGFAGTGVNTVTKSGTNTFKGSVYQYSRNENYLGYTAGPTTVVKTPFDYSIRGFSLGGPIIKDKLFFFVSGERVRQDAPATSLAASDATHAAGGNYSQANADTLTALSSFLKTKYGYDPGAFQSYTFKTYSDKVTAKLDWNINSKNTFTLKYNYLKSSADQFASTSRPGSGQTTGGQPGTYSMPFYGSGYVINNNFNILIAELNTHFNNRLSNKLQVGYTALRDFRSPHSSSATLPLVDILNNGNIYTTFGYEMYTYNNKLNTDVLQLNDILTYYKGAHEITVGTQNSIKKYQNAFAPGYQGVYQFNSLTDFYNSAKNGTANAKSYYLQYSALPGGAFPWANAGSTELSQFIQDKWKVTNDFTLTVGLRFDETLYKQVMTDNPTFDALKFKDGSSYNIGKAPMNNVIISPRLGFNWNPMGDKTLQVRGGTGIFAGPPPFVWISNQASNNGIQFGSFTKSKVAFNADPTAYLPTAGAANSSYSTALVSSKFKYPTAWKSSLAVDKRLDGGWVVGAEYNYTQDINAVYYSNINLNESNGFALGGVDNRTRYLTVANSNKYYAGTPTASLENPNIGNAILMSNSSQGYTYTLTGKIQRTAENLAYGIAYTHSVSKNTAEGGSTASSLWSAAPVANQDPNSANLGYASYYQPNRIIANFAYKINEGDFLSTTIGAIYELANNGVNSYVYNGDLNGDGNSGNDLMYIPKVATDINLVKVNSGGLGTGTTGVTDTRTSAQIWSQLDAFISNSTYLNTHRGGYAKRNATVAPYYSKLDLNITQDVKINVGKETHTLKFSLDVINAGNFINRDWGVVKIPTATNILKYEGLSADGKTPSFSLPFQTGTTPFTQPYQNSTGISSRWQMMFGIKYLFN